MDTNTLSIALIVTLPLLFALGVGVLVLLVRRWRAETDHAVELSLRDLDEARGQTADLRAVQAEFAQLHRQPYTDMAQELLQAIEAVDQAALELERTRLALEARQKLVAGTRLRALLYAVPDAHGQHQFVAELERRRDQLQDQLDRGGSAARALFSVPGEMAARAVQVLEGIEALEGLLAGMHLDGLHGRMMEEADDALLRLQQSRVHFPKDFDASGEANAQHQTASDLFDLLGYVQPLLGEWLPRVRSWERQFQRAIDTYERLQKTSANFRLALSTPPPVLIITRFQAGLLQVAAAATELNGQLGSAEVQSLRSLDREINHLDRILWQMAEEYDQAVVQVAELDHLLLELESYFKLLAGRMAEAEVQEDYPLVWDVSQPLKLELQAKIAALGGRETQRTPEQVTAALLGAAEQLKRLTALLARSEEQVARYADLVSLLTSPDLVEGGEWIKRAMLLSREVAVYDPANWNKADDLSGLLRDLSVLDETQRKLVPINRPAALQEAALARRGEDTRLLAGLHQRMRPRVEQIRARLSELRQIDRDARENLERLSATLDQIGLLLNGNPFLKEVAAVELVRLSGEAARLKDEFERPEVGVLEKKVARLNAQIEAVLRATGAWFDRLCANLQVHTAKITDALTALDGLAQIEDRDVSDARDLLRRVAAGLANPRPVTYLEAAAALKRVSADWLAVTSCAAALEQFCAPVLSSANDAEQARSSVRAVLQSAPKSANGRREWPPSRAILENEAAEFYRLEDRLDGLRKQRWSASRLVREMGLIYHELDKLDVRATSALRAVEGERAAIIAAEQRVSEASHKLEALAQRNADQPGVVSGVRDLIKQAEQRLSYLRAQYRRGHTDYDQALKGVEELGASLYAAQFSTAEGQSLSLE